MPDETKDTFLTSLILEHSILTDPITQLKGWLSEKNIPTGSLQNNPAIRIINPEGESIKIADIRAFTTELSFTGYTQKTRYYVFLNFHNTTLPAQNAALKAIEEPPSNTQIILIANTLDTILPTILSRCTIISNKKKNSAINNDKIAKAYKEILTGKHHDLIEIASRYKDRELALEFLNQLLSYLHTELSNKKSIYSTQQLRFHLQLTLTTLEQLQKNVNVILALENYLFQMIS